MVKWTCAGKVPTFEIVDLSVEGEFNKINTMLKTSFITRIA